MSFVPPIDHSAKHRGIETRQPAASRSGRVRTFRPRWPCSPLNLAIILVCLLSIAAIWLVTLQRTAFEREQAVTAAMASNANLAIAFEQQAFRTLKAAEQVAAFVRILYLQRGPEIRLDQLARQRMVREGMFTIISVVDQNGKVVSSTRPVELVNYADREFFRMLRDKDGDALFISPPVLGRITGSWQLPMALRITNPVDGSFGGVVVMSVDPASLTSFYREVDLGSHGFLELTGLDGIVRSRTSSQRSTFALDARDLPWFQRRAIAPEGSFLDDGRQSDGVARLISYRTMDDFPVMVTVATDHADAVAAVTQRRSGYFLAAGSATLALVVFAGLLILTLSRQRAVAQALVSSEALFRATFNQAATGIAHIAPDGRILGANEKFCRMLGYDLAALRGNTIFALGEIEAQDAMRQLIAGRLLDDQPAFAQEIERTYRRKDGSLLWVCEALGVVRAPDGAPDFLVVVSQDITARKTLEMRLAHDALHDALTGLPNRVMFHDRLARVIEAGRRHGGLAAVLYVDLDGFKDVNDNQGHAAGDALLALVGHRLTQCVRAEDTVARLGGDEFGIVLATVSSEQGAAVVAGKIVQALSQPFAIGETRVRISASVGVALFPIHGDDAQALLAHADAAMYAAKHAGRQSLGCAPAAQELA